MTAGVHPPVLCLVTDRRRLTPGQPQSLVRLCAHAAAAGVTLIQVRESGLNDRQLVGLVRAIVAETRESGAKVVVNDRTDIALAAGADGVHLRADSPPFVLVKRVVPQGFLVGRSVHDDVEAAREATAGADYLILGTVYPSGSKPPTSPVLGVEGFGRIAAAVSVPVLAIGGIAADKVGEMARAGAAGIAAIGLFADLQREATDDDALGVALRRLVADLRAAFAERRSGGDSRYA